MSEKEHPPSPEGLPILGNGVAFSRDPVEAMESWAAHGDLVHLRFMGESMYLVTHPDLIKQILVEEQHKFTIGPEQQETVAGVEDHAMTTATGDRWKRLRRAAHPAFTRESIASYGDRMASVTARFVDEWNNGEQVNLHAEMRRLTVQILGETLLNEDLRGRFGGSLAMRLAGVSMILAGAIAFMGIITAEVLYPNYSMRQDISDIGSTMPPDPIIHEPSATIFNSTMLLTRTLVLLATYLVHRSLGRRVLIIPLAVFGVGIFGVGVFPGNITP